MTPIPLTQTDPLRRRLEDAADADAVSVDEFVRVAVAEKLSARDRFADRARGASREQFLAALALVPPGEVVEGDELPAEFRGGAGRVDTR